MRPSRSPSRRRSTPSRSHGKSESADPPLVCFPGGGTLFWWQMGAATKLFELYDVSDVVMPGYSAGALAAGLSRCGVEPVKAHDVAFKLADDAGVFTNPLGLACKWGRLVYAWLDELLPANAHNLCDGLAAVVLTKLTPLPRVATTKRFGTRDDLIFSLMASTHIPFFMDGCFTRTLPDTTTTCTTTTVPAAASPGTIRVVDGGFLEFLGLATPESLLTHGCTQQQRQQTKVVLDALRDPTFTAACKKHGWSALKPVGTEHFLEYGALYVEEQAALGAHGALAPLDARLRVPRAKVAASSRRARQRADEKDIAVSVSVLMPLVHLALFVMGIGMISLECAGLASTWLLAGRS